MNIVTESMNMDHHINWGKRSITLQNGEVQIKNGVIAHVGAQNSDEVTNANGYTLYRKDAKQDSHDRGVATLVKDRLKIKPLSNFKDLTSLNIEYLNLIVQSNFYKEIIITCLYRHPDYNKTTLQTDYEFFEDFFTELCKYGKNVYVLGDFNLRDQKYVTPLNGILDKLSLHQLIQEPTRDENTLDLIITNNLLSIVDKSVYNPQLSDHSCIECTVSCLKPQADKKQLSFRNYKNLNPADVTTQLNNLSINVEEDVENATKYIINNIVNIFNMIVPIRNCTYYAHQKRKFVSSETKNLIKQRDTAYKLFRRDPLPRNKVIFCQFKTKVKQKILHDTKDEFNKKVQNLLLWGALEKLYPMLSPAADVNLDPDEINSFFVAISTRNSTSPPPQLPPKPSFPWDNNPPSFQIRELSREDVIKAWEGSKIEDRHPMTLLG
ncbi:hypothetical protein Fcan01_26881 [Folsomia candida]|uniref:Endonuclease/exonuclease/phosphatase domain-containing protein n=1 Tax=Folsomia candida TaxID=158441 RepID=A0A226D164_FOLCA|nr:hypothetical protein Fcan01_26881 [Folsomia candida]